MGDAIRILFANTLESPGLGHLALFLNSLDLQQMRDANGNTIMMYAAERGNLEAVEMLYARGGSEIAALRNNAGQTALRIAYNRSSSEGGNRRGNPWAQVVEYLETQRRYEREHRQELSSSVRAYLDEDMERFVQEFNSFRLSE